MSWHLLRPSGRKNQKSTCLRGRHARDGCDCERDGRGARQHVGTHDQRHGA